jgi:peptide methionine sulfoxide reductase MsrB
MHVGARASRPAVPVQVHDNSIPFMPRVEVVDARSGAHLGTPCVVGKLAVSRAACMTVCICCQ